MACGLPYFHKHRKWLVTGTRFRLKMSYVTLVMNGCLLVGAKLSLTIIFTTIYDQCSELTIHSLHFLLRYSTFLLIAYWDG